MKIIIVEPHHVLTDTGDTISCEKIYGIPKVGHALIEYQRGYLCIATK